MSPLTYFVVFLVMLGWEGPLLIWNGLAKGEMVELGIGLLITLFFWGAFGWGALLEAGKSMFSKHRNNGRGST